MRPLAPVLFLLACDTPGSASPVYIGEVQVSPGGEGGLSLYIIAVTSEESAAKCGDAAKCISYETMNPLSAGRVVADTAVTIAGAEVAAGEDLAGQAIWTADFPVELYSYEEFALGFDDSAITFAEGTTTLTFAWDDEEGTTYEDTVTVTDGVIAEG